MIGDFDVALRDTVCCLCVAACLFGLPATPADATSNDDDRRARVAADGPVNRERAVRVRIELVTSDHVGAEHEAERTARVSDELVARFIEKNLLEAAK